MADNVNGISIKELELATALNNDDDMVVEDKTPKTKRTKLSTLANKIKEILKIGDRDISGIGDGTVKGAISEINSNFTLKTGNFSFNASAAQKYNDYTSVEKISGLVIFRLGFRVTKQTAKGAKISVGSVPTGFIPKTVVPFVVVDQNSAYAGAGWLYGDGRVEVYTVRDIGTNDALYSHTMPYVSN